MELFVTIMGKTIGVNFLNNQIASILLSKTKQTLSDNEREYVMTSITNYKEFNDTELSILESNLKSNVFSAFSIYQTLTSKAVFDTAIELINKNGTTTSLEIRDALREKNYWAKCFRVREILSRDYDTYNLKFSVENNHKVWSLNNNVTSTSVPSSNTNVNSNSTSATPRKNKWDSTKIADWFVTHKHISEIISNTTRNVAKWLFAKKNDIPYKDVRAKINK